MARGTLRIYLGAAPGVGKTFAMLNEGYRRWTRGTDVVVAYVETHGRPHTAEQLRDLEVIPRRTVEYRGAALEEMDVDAVLARRPEVALVDELAHTNAPGVRHEKRWQDVETLLEAGIHVISTVNIQHLESVNDVVERITGVEQRETVPDAIVRSAEQVELVDMTPEALRRRMAHGNVYRPEKVDAALGNYFRVGNLTALRELALLWVADQVDDALIEYRERHGIAEPWETRERVVVALTGVRGGDDLVRRAARIASRLKAELVGVHVRVSDGLTSSAGPELETHKKLLADLGGSYREVVDSDIARGLVQTATAENATQLVLGASRRSRWVELTRGSVINEVVAQAGNRIDLHIISGLRDPSGGELGGSERVAPFATHRRWHSRVSSRRRNAGVVAAVIGLPVLAVLLHLIGDRLGFTSVALLFLVAVVLLGVLGGAAVAGASAIIAFLLLDLVFIEPKGKLTIGNERELIALVVFLVVAAVISVLVERVASRTELALRSRTHAQALATIAASLLREDDPLPGLTSELVSTFGLQNAAVLQQAVGGYIVEASAGEVPPPGSPGEAGLAMPIGDDVWLTVDGAHLAREDREVLDAFAAQLAIALDSRALRARAAEAAELARTNELQGTLLATVSHDLRTPLATIKLAVSSLRDRSLDLGAEANEELLASVEKECDRLDDLVGNLLDLGRIRADALDVVSQPVAVDDVIAHTLDVTHLEHEVVVDLRDDLPTVGADPVLLERVLANLLANADRFEPPGSTLAVRAARDGGVVAISVVDHGPGVPRADRERIFEPFQRLAGQPEQVGGVGLGLAVARGLVDAMGGALTLEDTPGGGTTMVVELEVAEP